MQDHIIYIPGLGDRKTYGQHIAIKLWRFFGLHTHYQALGWTADEGIEAKLDRVSSTIDQLTSRGYRVSIAGVSAGASAALNLYAKHPEIYKVILICGKVHRPDNIQSDRYTENPDFKLSMNTVADSLNILKQRGDIKNILSFYSPNDHVVPPRDSHIEGADSRRALAWSHASVIISTIFLMGPAIANFIRRSKY